MKPGQEAKCKHCHQRIVVMNYLLGPAWTHQPSGSAFHDNVHEYCKITIAEPK